MQLTIQPVFPVHKDKFKTHNFEGIKKPVEIQEWFAEILKKEINKIK